MQRHLDTAYATSIVVHSRDDEGVGVAHEISNHSKTSLNFPRGSIG